MEEPGGVWWADWVFISALEYAGLLPDSKGLQGFLLGVCVCDTGDRDPYGHLLFFSLKSVCTLIRPPRWSHSTLVALSLVTVRPHVASFSPDISSESYPLKYLLEYSFVILFPTGHLNSWNVSTFFLSSCAFAGRNSVFTVEQVTFLADIFSVVQLEKVKVPGSFVWGILFTFSLRTEIEREVCSHVHLYIF